MRRLPSFEHFVVIVWIGVLVNFASGALVRVTNSGLGCPDWPLCHGRPTPPFAGHAVIEYSNRILAGGVVILGILLAYRAWSLRHRWFAVVLAVVLFGQIPLGALTIRLDLHPIAVASHYMLAILALTLSTILLVDVHLTPAGEADRPAWLMPATIVFLAWGLALIISGTIVTTSGPHPGADHVPRLYSLVNVAYWHVRIAVSYVVFLAAFLFLISRLDVTNRRLPRLAWAVVVLTALQILIGETQWRDQLPWYLVGAHATNAAMLWGALVGLGRSLVPATAVSPSRAPSRSPARA